MAPVVHEDENSMIFEHEKLWIAVLALVVAVASLMLAIAFCACGGKNEGKAGEKEPEKAATYLDLDPGGPAAEPKADAGGSKRASSGLSPPPAVPSNSKTTSGGKSMVAGDNPNYQTLANQSKFEASAKKG